jgi:hypothetical protein
MKLLILSILCVFSCAFNFEDTDYNNVSLAGQTTDETTTSETTAAERIDNTTEETTTSERTATQTNDNTTEETTTTTTLKPKISSSTGSTRNVEVIVTPSIYRLIDQAFRERLINFESRIAALLEDRERVRDEIESFKPAVDEDFFNGAFIENERYFLIMIFVF